MTKRKRKRNQLCAGPMRCKGDGLHLQRCGQSLQVPGPPCEQCCDFCCFDLDGAINLNLVPWIWATLFLASCAGGTKKAVPHPFSARKHPNTRQTRPQLYYLDSVANATAALDEGLWYYADPTRPCEPMPYCCACLLSPNTVAVSCTASFSVSFDPLRDIIVKGFQ
jgi:hypothetical protein